MSTTTLIILGLIGIFVAYLVYNFRKMKNMPNIPDHDNVLKLNKKNFNNQVKKGVVLVDFWAEWCGPCKMMAPTLNDLAENNSDDLTVAKVNVDEQRELAQKFNIRNIPTMILFNNGKEAKRLVGIKSKKNILSEVNELSSAS